MPTVNEMRLLDDAMSDLAGTFQRNRAMKQQEKRDAVRAELEREELGMRKADQAESQLYRQGQSAETARHHKALEDYQSEIKRAQQESNADRRNEAMFKIFSEMGQNGMLTDDALKAMEGEFSKRFGQAGVGVKLFKLPPKAAGTEPRAWQNPATKRNYTVYGNTIMDADRARAKRTIEEDPLNPGQMKERITQDLNEDELDQLLQKRAAPKTEGDPVTAARIKALQKQIEGEASKIGSGDETTGFMGFGEGREARIRRAQSKIEELQGKGKTPGPAPSAQPTPVNPPSAAAAPAGDRVRVISPEGKTGTIPRAKLNAALAKGFKLAEVEDEALGER